MTLRCHFTLKKSVSIVGLTRFFLPLFGDNYVTTNEDTLILSGTKMFVRDSSFWQCKIYSDMCYGLRARRRQLTVRAIFVDSRASVAMQVC